MKSVRVWIFLFFGMLLIGNVALSQGAGGAGSIAGTITDPSGAVLTNASITATDTEKGITRTALSDSSGHFQIYGLPVATYEVSVAHSGFRASVQKIVVVSGGRETIADFRMSTSTALESVEVATAVPVIDTKIGHQAETIDSRYIRELPINQRNYSSFTLLLPGVSDARSFTGVDFHVRQTPQSGLSFYGSNGRGNNITVDGSQFNGDSGAAELNLSHDAVQEFQINRSSYSADLGAASGAAINIVSKSGSNNLHGSLYGFFRDDIFNARNPFAYTNALVPGVPFSLNATSRPVTNTLSRQQYGATLGFPITPDKTFFFAAYEGVSDHGQTAAPLLTNSNIFAPDTAARGNDQQEILNGLAAQGGTHVPCLTGQPAVSSAFCANILQNILTVNPASSPLSSFLVNQFESNGGLFPQSIVTNSWSGRMDHSFNDNDQAYLRGVYGWSKAANLDVGALTGISRGSAVREQTSSLLGAWYHQFSPTTQNELRAQWNLVQFNVLANEPGSAAINIGPYQFGRNNTLPDFSTLRQYEFADNLTLIRERHTIKFGIYEDVRGNRTASSTFFSSTFSFSSLSGGVLSPCLQVPAACGLSGVTPAILNPLQAFTIGLPQIYQQGFGNPTTVSDLPLTAAYVQDSWALRPNFVLHYGVRYDRDTRDIMPTDKLNFAPRASFAWDVFHNHKTVVRGGGGLFYSPTYAQIDIATRELSSLNAAFPQIANYLIPLTGAPGNPALTSAAVFQTLLAQGRLGNGMFPINPCGLSAGPLGAGSGACVTQANLAIFGPLNAFTNFYSVPRTFHNPYSEQASFGIENEITRDMSFSVDYAYVHTLQLPWTQNLNLLPTAPIVSGAPGTNGLPFQTWNPQYAPKCALIVGNPCLANPLRVGYYAFASTGSAIYNGLTLELKKRFSDHYSVLANYTFSKAIDNVSDFSSAYAPQNNTNLALDRGLSSFDQRHKVSFAGIFESPWKNVFLTGFQFSPIVNYNSGHPFNLLSGVDTNGDNNLRNDRPPQAGRNTGIGPDYVGFDARLSRRFKITEDASVQLMAEGFNLLNRANYSSLNNFVGAGFAPPFNVYGSSAVSPSLPLGFTAASASRELQLGVRVAF